MGSRRRTNEQEQWVKLCWHTSSDRATRWIYKQLDVFLRVFSIQKQKLTNDKISSHIIHLLKQGNPQTHYQILPPQCSFISFSQGSEWTHINKHTKFLKIKSTKQHLFSNSKPSHQFSFFFFFHFFCLFILLLFWACFRMNPHEKVCKFTKKTLTRTKRVLFKYQNNQQFNTITSISLFLLCLFILLL